MYVVRDEIKEKIMTQYVEKAYEYDVESLIQGRRRWKRTGQAFETMSKIFLAVGGIMSFSSYYYKIDTLSFLSGSVSVISLACLQFSSFCYLENKKQSNELNVILRKLGIETIPELSRELENLQIQRTPPDFINMRKISRANRDTHVVSINEDEPKGSTNHPTSLEQPPLHGPAQSSYVDPSHFRYKDTTVAASSSSAAAAVGVGAFTKPQSSDRLAPSQIVAEIIQHESGINSAANRETGRLKSTHTADNAVRTGPFGLSPVINSTTPALSSRQQPETELV